MNDTYDSWKLASSEEHVPARPPRDPDTAREKALDKALNDYTNHALRKLREIL